MLQLQKMEAKWKTLQTCSTKRKSSRALGGVDQQIIKQSNIKLDEEKLCYPPYS